MAFRAWFRPLWRAWTAKLRKARDKERLPRLGVKGMWPQRPLALPSCCLPLPHPCRPPFPPPRSVASDVAGQGW